MKRHTKAEQRRVAYVRTYVRMCTQSGASGRRTGVAVRRVSRVGDRGAPEAVSHVRRGVPRCARASVRAFASCSLVDS